VLALRLVRDRRVTEMSNKSRSTKSQPWELSVESVLRTLVRLVSLGLLVAILVLLVQHKTDVHNMVYTNTSGQAVNVPDMLQQILTLLNISINNTSNDHTTIVNMLQGLQNSSTNITQLLVLIQNDTATCNLLLQQLQGNVTTLNTLLLLVDGNITQLNVLLQSVKNDTTLLIQMLQQHGADTLRWLIGTEDVNGTWCNDYESCTSNILMPDSTCRFPQKSKNSSCFDEDRCHFHTNTTDPSKFYCDTEASQPYGVCRTTQNDSLCRGWCSGNFSTVLAECVPRFTFLNSTFLTSIGIGYSCVARSCVASFSFASVGVHGGENLNCDFKFNTSIEYPPSMVNNSEYLDHCIQGNILGGYGSFMACAYRYKCAEPVFHATAIAAAIDTMPRLCMPIDANDLSRGHEEYDADAFFGPMAKTPTLAQYAQMVTEYHQQVWGQPECPSRRKRVAVFEK
jgi:hypothetical protein